MKKLRIRLLKLFCLPSRWRVRRAIKAYNLKQINSNWAYEGYRHG